MKKSLLLCLCLLAGGVSAQEAERSPAEKLLEVTRYEEMSLDSAMAAFDGAMKAQTESLPKAAVAEIREEALKLYKRIFTGEEARRKIVELYQKHFTDDELNEMIEFYSTPLGRKTLVMMPSIMQDAMANVMPVIEREMPAFQKKVAEIAERHLDDAPGGAAEEQPEQKEDISK